MSSLQRMKYNLWYPGTFRYRSLSQRSGTCPVRCPSLSRPIIKRLVMTGSRLGRLRGDPTSPRVPDGWGPGLRSINPGSWTESTCFPEGLTRKLYRKKIPKTAIDLSNSPEEKSVWTKWTKGAVFPASLTRKVYRKKIPEIM